MSNDEVNIEEKAADERVQQAIAQLMAQMPNEIVLVNEDDEPYDEDETIVLDDATKHNLALLMLATGEDFETVVNNTIASAVEALDSDEEE